MSSSSVLICRPNGVVQFPEVKRFAEGDSQDAVSRLPYDLFAKCVEYLPPNECLAIKLTTRRLYDQTVKAVTQHSSAKTVMTMWKLENLAKFHWQGYNEDLSLLTSQHVNKLSKLILLRYDSIIFLNPEINEKITSLDFDDDDNISNFRDTILQFPNLEEITVRELRDITISELDVLTECPSLKSITILDIMENISYERSASLFAFLAEHPHIRLDLVEESAVAHRGFLEMSRFILGQELLPEDNWLASIAPYSRRLRHLMSIEHVGALELIRRGNFPIETRNQIEELSFDPSHCLDVIHDIEALMPLFPNVTKLNIDLSLPMADATQFLQNLRECFSLIRQVVIRFYNNSPSYTWAPIDQSFSSEELHEFFQIRTNLEGNLNFILDCFPKNIYISLDDLKIIARGVDPKNTGEDLSKLAPFCPRMSKLVILSQNELSSLRTLPIKIRNNIVEVAFGETLTPEAKQAIQAVFPNVRLVAFEAV